MHFHLLRGDGRGKGPRVTRNTASQAHGHSELQALSAGPVNTDRGCVQERVPYILKAAPQVVSQTHQWVPAVGVSMGLLFCPSLRLPRFEDKRVRAHALNHLPEDKCFQTHMLWQK